jgi:hypothetical protein
MKLALTPLIVAILFVSFFVRGEVLVATRAEHGYIFADITFVLCFLVLFGVLFFVLFTAKYDPARLLRVRANKKRIFEFIVFCLILAAYILLAVKFGGNLVSSRFAILLVPLPLLALLYLLELRWLRDT